MKFKNCSLNEIKKVFGKRSIVFFGGGSWLKYIDHSELMELKNRFECIVDNNPGEELYIGDILLKVHYPAYLEHKKNRIIVLTSPVYMMEMYEQLQTLDIDDTNECYAFPFMQLITDNNIDSSLLGQIKNSEIQRIPKIIHSFWFSKERKPDIYRNCTESWKRVLGDYKIYEWNTDNYDWHKNPFMERAISIKAWAFATDYARLDVLKKFGGIYLDMDVEVFRPFDDLLGNEAMFSFSNHVSIDLAVVGAAPNNLIINKLLKEYDNVALPESREEFARYFQPAFVRPAFVKEGVLMNGSLQKKKNMTVFPNEFFMPQDHIIFREFKRTENTYCVHYDNFGWSFGKESKREKKLKNNRLLWSKLDTVTDMEKMYRND